MLNIFKNIFFLPIILLAALVTPTYAAEMKVTYYAFVTHNINGLWERAKPIEPANLAIGSYRFQIVRFSQIDTSQAWIALRGEFQFVDDKIGGVKIKDKYTLDKYQRVANQPNVNLSIWNNKSWKKRGRKWVQPLFAQMKNTFSGSFEPNFMRFLLKDGVEETWNNGDKNYSLYRLHYLDADTINNNYKKAFSRFINPSVEATTEIESLKQWVDSQKSFALAEYLGIADEKHQEFYGNFKTWFNQLFSEITQASVDSERETAWYSFSGILYILLGIIIISLIIIALLLFTQAYRIYHNSTESYFNIITRLVDEKLRQLRHSQNNRQNTYKSSKSKFSEQNFDDALFSSNDSPQSYVSRGDFDSLWEQVRKLYDTQDKQNIQAVEDLEKDFIRLFDKNLSKLSQSAVFKKAVQAEINASMAHLNTYFNEKLDEIVHNQLERHAKQYWDKLKKEYENKEIALNRRHSTIQRQHDTPVAKKESSTKPQLEVKQVEVKQKVRQPLAKKESSTKPQLEVKQVEVKQKVRQPYNNVVDKIKTILLSMKSVEEGALKTLDFSVKPCAFVIDVVANCLKLNQPATHYQRLANAIAKLTGGKVALIISSVGDEIRPEEHNVVGQKTVTKGKQNVVVSLIRPGVKCDNVIKRKAEIIQSVSSNG